jgi:hypothetical protein
MLLVSISKSIVECILKLGFYSHNPYKHELVETHNEKTNTSISKANAKPQTYTYSNKKHKET